MKEEAEMPVGAWPLFLSNPHSDIYFEIPSMVHSKRESWRAGPGQ